MVFKPELLQAKFFEMQSIEKFGIGLHVSMLKGGCEHASAICEGPMHPLNSGFAHHCCSNCNNSLRVGVVDCK